VPRRFLVNRRPSWRVHRRWQRGRRRKGISYRGSDPTACPTCRSVQHKTTPRTPTSQWRLGMGARCDGRRTAMVGCTAPCDCGCCHRRCSHPAASGSAAATRCVQAASASGRPAYSVVRHAGGHPCSVARRAESCTPPHVIAPVHSVAARHTPGSASFECEGGPHIV
jgi:hypothetical protein